VAGLTGPISADLISELESLKLSLVETNPEDFDAAGMKTLGVEISAIRLQLKRLAAERRVMAAEIQRRALDG
jgi:hypothetical protein